MPTYTPEGYLYISVSTPNAFAEALLPDDPSEDSSEEARERRKINSLAEQQGTHTHACGYRRGEDQTKGASAVNAISLAHRIAAETTCYIGSPETIALRGDDYAWILRKNDGGHVGTLFTRDGAVDFLVPLLFASDDPVTIRTPDAVLAWCHSVPDRVAPL